ncbi:hypothetical protein ACFLT7_06225 [candidate division KSB1 bacterium]
MKPETVLIDIIDALHQADTGYESGPVPRIEKQALAQGVIDYEGVV